MARPGNIHVYNTFHIIFYFQENVMHNIKIMYRCRQSYIFISMRRTIIITAAAAPPRRLHRTGSHRRRRTADRYIRFVPLLCRIFQNASLCYILYTTVVVIIRKQYLPMYYYYYYILYTTTRTACVCVAERRDNKLQ